MKVSALLAAIVACALPASAETILLDFTAKWCGPCRQMDPVVAGLEREGYRVERIDIDKDAARKRQFNVTNVPTFVAVRDGKEIGRVVGAVPADRLRKLLGPVGARPVKAQTSPDTAPPAEARSIETNHGASDSSDHVLIQRSVRITVDEPKSRSFGTGTIIRSGDGETLILTCSHLFEGLSKAAKTTIEFYAGSKAKLPGELVTRDRDSDIALVRVATDEQFPAAPIATRQFTLAAGQPTVSVGCDNGQPASIRRMQITAVNRYLGSPTIECTGQPAQGRSGGGLFNQAGELIGVCSAAEPKEKRGIYGGLAAVHAILKGQGLASLYDKRVPADSRVVTASGREKTAVTPITLPSPEEMGLRVDEGLSISAKLDAAELVCVIRSRDNADAPAKVIAIKRPSPELIAQLEKEEKSQSSTRASTAMRLIARPDVRPVLTESTAPDSKKGDDDSWQPARGPTTGDGAAVKRPPVQESAKWKELWIPGADSADSVGTR